MRNTSLLIGFFVLFSLSFSPAPEQKLVHVFVALCDNDSQGIVPVPKKIGNGNDPDNNLYWGCGYGVRTFFKGAAEWKLLKTLKNPKEHILERLVFKHKTSGAILVADAYRGSKIKACTIDFFKNASGVFADTLTVAGKAIELNNAQLICYVGHDGLMDFNLEGNYPKKLRDVPNNRQVMIYACISKSYFETGLQYSGAYPLIRTTGLMCPEAYTIKAAVDGWILGETGAQIKERCAVAYDHYLKCGMKGARGLFITGW